MIEVEGLRKTYGDLIAVDEVSFTAPAGRIFGLLGPNGAGKTTTIGCISGLLAPTAGRVRVLGHDVVAESRAARENLGVVPQELALYEDLGAADNLAFWAGAYGLAGAEARSRVDEVLAVLGLADRAREPVKRFSGGMKRRLNLGCGIVHRPHVLLLDEPTAGVDPQSRVHLLGLVRKLADEGACVLYTTHYMEEAEHLCDELAVMDHGRVIARGTLEELRARAGERDVLRLSGTFDAERARTALSALDSVSVAEATAETVRLAVPGATRRLPEILNTLADAGGEIQETILTRPSLESLFIDLTGRELRE